MDEVSFEVPRGVISGFVGPNGAGKTTTMRAILSLIKPDSGEIKIFGKETTRSTSYLQKIGSMIEAPAFLPSLSGAQNLKILASLHGIKRLNYQSYFDLVGLQTSTKTKYKSYSLGMKQRLGIAAALLNDPELLILDEPTNGLDPLGVAQIRELLKNLAIRGKTILISSHLLAELEMISDHFVIMRGGQVVFQGARTELLQGSESNLYLKPEFYVDINKLALLAQRLGFATVLEGEEVKVIRGGNWAAEFNRWSSENQITLQQIRTVEPNLESSFLKLSRLE